MAGKGRLPDELKIVGAARTPLSDDAFRQRLAKAVREFVKDDWNDEKWRVRQAHLLRCRRRRQGGRD